MLVQIDGLVDHFMQFQREERVLPVVWHQCLLCFVQRYAVRQGFAVWCCQTQLCIMHAAAIARLHITLGSSENHNDIKHHKTAIKCGFPLSSDFWECFKHLQSVFVIHCMCMYSGTSMRSVRKTRKGWESLSKLNITTRSHLKLHGNWMHLGMLSFAAIVVDVMHLCRLYLVYDNGTSSLWNLVWRHYALTCIWWMCVWLCCDVCGA